ncbi:MAG: hypothetical protein ACM31L_06030 [Actinomycetota bacterium]
MKGEAETARQALAQARKHFDSIPASYGGKHHLGQTLAAMEEMVDRLHRRS